MWPWDVALECCLGCSHPVAQQGGSAGAQPEQRMLLDPFGICQRLPGTASLAQHPMDSTQPRENPGSTPGHAKLRETGGESQEFSQKGRRERKRERMKKEGMEEKKKKNPTAFPVFPCVSVAWRSPSAHCSVYP